MNHRERDDNSNGRIMCVIGSEAECDREQYIRAAAIAIATSERVDIENIYFRKAPQKRVNLPDRGSLTFLVPSQNSINTLH